MFVAYGRHTQAGIEARRRREDREIPLSQPAPPPAPVEVDAPPATRLPDRPKVTPIRTPAMATRQMIAEVAELYGCTFSEVVSDKRQRNIVDARHAAIRAVRTANPHMSLPEIGRIFNRDHSTIFHSLKQPVRAPRRRS
ncbi:helix-turn-helix domain-containing protein [Tianweitania sediminis]|uniref:helix-turn-helix domain-containing protein n=2 Tax=Tianweitania sediminis TaxID=1502156 RepID=UPI00361FED28